MDSLWTKWWSLFVCTLAITISPALCSNGDSPKCLKMWPTLGVTFPSGDIIRTSGTPLEIFCILNSRKYNVTSLRFWRNNDIIPTQYIDIVNDTTIRLSIEKTERSRNAYYCKAIVDMDLEPVANNTKLVCWNFVIIEDEPKEVENFTCVSYNWEKLVCSWTPQKTYLVQTYNLTYSPQPNGGEEYECPGGLRGQKSKCVWDMSTKPLYHNRHRTLYFTMTINNTFGRNVKVYEINNFGIVLPSKPEGLSVQATEDSLTMTWSWPSPLHNFTQGLITKVIYKSQWDSENYWDEADTSHIPTNLTNVTFTISGLKYAHALYDIRVFLRSAASTEPYKWSKPATYTLHTKASVPSRPPKTDIGSYRVQSHHLGGRNLIIYWQRIPQYLENGDNIHYKVIEVKENGIKRDLKPQKVTNMYAIFEEVSSTSNYTFRIVSSNSVGDSQTYSEVFVPTSDNRPAEPGYFTKVAYAQGLYELSWMAPVNMSGIESYTLFWCEKSWDKPLDCTGELNWIRVPKDLTAKNISLSDVVNYQFSISANTNSMSSGMVQASCTLLLRKDVIKNIKGISMNKVGSDFIEINWMIDCTFRIEIIKNFVIYYCPIVSPYILTCREPEQNKTIPATNNHEMNNHVFTNVTGLKPYTTYMISLAIQMQNWISRTYPHFNTTLEAAPDMPPRDVQILDVTNTSVTLSWSPPEVLNGMLRQYKVFWGDKYTTVEEQTWVTLTNLESYTQYVLSVEACTIACSPKSAPILVKTKIGTPRRIETPTLKLLNNKLAVYWEKPLKLYANSNYYEVRVQQEEDGQLISENYYNLTEPPYLFEATDCRNADYNISIRAVNIDENNNNFYGPWSPPIAQLCSSQKIPWVVITLICLALALFSFIFLKWAYTCILKRSSVEIVLPRLFEISNIKEKDIDNSFAAHVNSQPHYQDNLSCDMSTTDQTSVQLMTDDDYKKKENEEYLEIEKCMGHNDTLKDEYDIYYSYNGNMSPLTDEPELLPFSLTSDSGPYQRSSNECSSSGSEACLLRQRTISGGGGIVSGGGVIGGGGIIGGDAGIMGGGGVIDGIGRGGYCQMGTTNGYVPMPPSWQLVSSPKSPVSQSQPQSPPPSNLTSNSTMGSPSAYCVLGIKSPSPHTSQV